MCSRENICRSRVILCLETYIRNNIDKQHKNRFVTYKADLKQKSNNGNSEPPIIF